jgi:nicotinate-nucleotide adenylyltransferase
LSAAQVGILGGSFNPPHVAHLVCAEEALSQLALDRVVFVPAGEPPHKPLDDPGRELRYELCRLAVADQPRFDVSRIELDRPGPSYTVDTLRALHDEAPEDELTFIAGGDMAQTLPAWHEPEELLCLARLAIAERSGVAREDLTARLAALDTGGRIAFFDMPRIDVSSSLIRRHVAEGRPIRYLVPDGVAARIAEAGLYREADGERSAEAHSSAARRTPVPAAVGASPRPGAPPRGSAR